MYNSHMNAKPIAKFTDDELQAAFTSTEKIYERLKAEKERRARVAYRAKLDGISVAHMENGIFRFFRPDGMVFEAVNVGEGRRLDQYSHYEVHDLRPKKRGAGYTRASRRGNLYVTFAELRKYVAGIEKHII